MRDGASSAHSRASENPAPGSPPSRGPADETITVAGTTLVADAAGAIYWPEEKLLTVADLHLEKGSAFAVRGVLLPPYDTAAILARLSGLIDRHAPRLVVALGDSFHDGGGPVRMAAADRATLATLQRGRAVSRRCFATDGRRLVMPAFGAYAGGLNVRDRAITALFGTLGFTAHMLGARRLFAIAAKRCLPD